MEIIINDEKLDYTLEGEKNLGDILRNLENWVNENGGIINHISVDEKDISLDVHSEFLNRTISSISSLRVQTSSWFDHAVSALQTVGVYIDKVIYKYLNSRDIDDYDLILEGIRLITEGVERSLKILHICDLVIVDRRGHSLRQTLQNMALLIDQYEKRYIDVKDRNDLGDMLTALRRFLPKIINWAVLKNSLNDNGRIGLDATFLKTALDDLEKIADQTLGMFEAIGEKLQIGRDGEALKDLCTVTEIMDEIIYLLQFFMTAYSMEGEAFTLSGVHLEELFSKISESLREVENSFADEDLISVGDILEYDIKPHFSTLISLLHRIRVFIQ
jgi:hypothetical protein